MKPNTPYPQESLSAEDWESLASFFKLLIEADKEISIKKVSSEQVRKTCHDKYQQTPILS